MVSGNLKIIDIAYKYGCETPEAFTKAFKRLHNISPSEAELEVYLPGDSSSSDYKCEVWIPVIKRA